MSLATRCTACGTVFRVVQDQLRVSEGWVRCGRCAEVFNATENLVDPPLSAAAAAPPPAMVRMGSTPAPQASQTAEVDLPLDDQDHDGPGLSRGHTGPPETQRTGDDAQGDFDVRADAANYSLAQRSARSDTRDAVDELVADPDDRYGASSLLPSDFEPSALPEQARSGATAFSSTGAATDADAGALPAGMAQPLPSFVRRADHAARWQQPRVRAALAALVLLAGLGLLAQAAHSYRDLLASRWPATQPLLAQACTLLRCTVQPPRLIDALVVDSSGLLRVERSNVYKLSVTLRNRDALAVALPALDLSLTDTQGRLLARRVLRMDELGQSQTALAPGAELVLQATLQTADAGPAAGVAGYTIDLFYP